MSSKTKIVVLRMKEIIYTAIFIGLGIILVTLLFIMLRPGSGRSGLLHPRTLPGFSVFRKSECRFGSGCGRRSH